MRDLDPDAQEKLIDLLNNKLSKVSNVIANPVKSSEAICSTVRRYRHKVVLDLKRLHNMSKKDPMNKGNRLKEMAKDLAAQSKIRVAHESTIEEQRRLIEELMSRNKAGNPALDRVRRDSNDSTLPPLGRSPAGRPGSSRFLKPDNNGRANMQSPAKSPLPMNTNTSMFQLQLGDDGPMGGMGGGPMGGGPPAPPGRGGRGARGPGRPGAGGRGGMGQGGPMFGGGRGDGRGGGRGPARRGLGRF